jgi:gliding motility associated protien GldN
MSQIKFLVLCLVFIVNINAFSQTNLLNAQIPQQIGVKNEEQLIADNDKPLAYGYIDDRDIFWSKVVWEYIDLNERINLPFYYPTDTMSIATDRRSMYDTLLRGIKQGKISEIYDDSYFNNKLTYEEINAKLYRIDTIPEGKELLYADPNADISEYIDKYTISSDMIEAFFVKGVWYIDSRQGEMKFRMLGIAPIAPDVQLVGRSDMDASVMNEKLPLFWVFYPNAREVMHEMKVFNPNNAAFPISFDHLLNAHRFISLIYKEENVYGDREVKNYVKGNSLFQVLESEKLKDDIRNKELDIWNY